MPLRDDWPAAAELIRRLDRAISSDVCTMEIILVDDGSVQRWDSSDFQSSFSVVRAIRTLRLRRNLGHQRGIAFGLVHVQQTISCDVVVVMNADVKDTPEGLTQLLRAYSESDGAKAIFAERTAVWNLLNFDPFIISTNSCIDAFSVRVGNFSILPSPT